MANVVEAARAPIAFLEDVRVMPESVGTTELNVDEMVWRIPLGDFRAPADGNTVDRDAIINQGPGTHHDGSRCEDFHLQPGRRDSLQVLHVGEELEDFIARTRKE